jgi:hypothetical protein
MNQDNLIKILEELKEVRTQTLTKVNDNTLWDTAIRIYNSESISNNRQGNKSSKPPFNSPVKDVPATEPQKKLLKELKYKGDLNSLTKLKAMEEIDKRIG